MTSKQIFQTISKKKWLVLWTTLLGAFLFFDFTVINPPQYKANSRVLVIQEQVAGQDIYAISKSAQYISKVLKEGIYSDTFFDKAIASSDSLNNENFPKKTKERREAWEENIEVAIERDLGIMSINTYRSDKEEARQLSLAVTETLVNNHKFFHGADKNIELKVLDYSLASNRPVMLRLWIITLIGAILGFSAGVFWAFKKEEKEASSLNGN